MRQASYSVILSPESAIDELMSDKGDRVQTIPEDETPLKHNTSVLIVEDSFCDPVDLMNSEQLVRINCQ